MAERCLKCGRLVFKKVDHKGNVAMETSIRLDLELEGGEVFFRCPHCSAKNVVVEATNRSGLPALRVSHIRE
ncbi:MAG: hypothetical protein JRI36_06430 [Deltaproteobacteria bacterium]|nr:hypothetical protein [Deltaproteobacteria bacterium]